MKVKPESKELRDETAKMLWYLRSKDAAFPRSKTHQLCLMNYQVNEGIPLELLHQVIKDHQQYKQEDVFLVVEESFDYDGYPERNLNSFLSTCISDYEYYEDVKETYNRFEKTQEIIDGAFAYQRALQSHGVNVDHHKAYQMYVTAVALHNNKHEE